MFHHQAKVEKHHKVEKNQTWTRFHAKDLRNKIWSFDPFCNWLENTMSVGYVLAQIRFFMVYQNHARITILEYSPAAAVALQTPFFDLRVYLRIIKLTRFWYTLKINPKYFNMRPNVVVFSSSLDYLLLLFFNATLGLKWNQSVFCTYFSNCSSSISNFIQNSKSHVQVSIELQVFLQKIVH